MTNHPHHPDEEFMQRAMELARIGQGYVSPNPLVGSVIVHDGKIIGEGWHKKYGGPHAEVNAVDSVKNKNFLRESTMYVNLEPCSHYGKTPPCADMLIKNQLKRVVISNLDSNPLVSGDGIRKLRDAGIEVTTGVLEQEGRLLNKRFFTWTEKTRPYIILKWAQTVDGFMARENYDSKWISNEYSRQLVHKWRTEEDGILVGSGTVRHDDPHLNVRDWSGRNPVRIIIDRFLTLNHNLHVFDNTQKTIFYNLLKDEEGNGFQMIRINEEKFFHNLINDLYTRKIQSVLVEGGSQTLRGFIANNLWDEARVFISANTFGKGIGAPALAGNLIEQRVLETDVLRIYYPADSKL